jgi:hypothetical protein
MSSIFDNFGADSNSSELARVPMQASLAVSESDLDDEFSDEDEYNNDFFKIDHETESVFQYNTEAQAIKVDSTTTLAEYAMQYASFLGFEPESVSSLNFIYNNQFMDPNSVLEPGKIVTISRNHSTKG